MLNSLDTSLRLLQTDCIDLWQIHTIDDSFFSHADIAAEVFYTVKKSGKIRAIGGSTYGTEMPLQALSTDLFDVLQVGYSVFDQRQADETFPLAAQKNVGIVARSLLLQGVLTQRGDYLPEPLAVLREWSRQFRQLAARIQPSASAAQLALTFGLAHPQIGTALIGVRTESELEEHLRAAHTTLPDALLGELYALRIDDANLLDPRWWEQFLQDQTLVYKDRAKP